jgi:peptidoglycan/xylan/chitin deacetylase (PgdA/CDA1 family)
MEKRSLVLAGRLAALAGVLLLRGRPRFAAWAAHDFLWLYPTLRRNCDWHGKVLTRFETPHREVWLTIDDGPDPSDTPNFLDLLARHGARASFFAIGKKAAAHPELCRRIIAEGHTLENHSHSHPAAYWWTLPRPLVRRELTRAQTAILEAGGVAPRLFRSPVGMNNPGVHPAATRLGLRVAGWSAEGRDGCPAAPTTIVRRIMRGVFPGAIILLHESGGNRHRALTLSRLLDSLAQANYRCVIPDLSALR